jgi:hypothetical protein
LLINRIFNSTHTRDASRLCCVPDRGRRRNLHKLVDLAAQIARQRFALVKLEPGNIVLLVTLAPYVHTQQKSPK